MKRKMRKIEAVYKIGRLVFTTREIAGLAGASVSSTVQALRRLEEKGITKNILRGVWGMVNDRRFSPFFIVPFLNPNHRAYVSFISALHSHGVISQIPQVITVASTAHSGRVLTPVGTYHIHQISPDFFDGFEWHESGDYLIAEPEKALVDCLYLASRKKRQFAHFPELDMSILKRKKVFAWAQKIKDKRVRKFVISRIKDYD